MKTTKRILAALSIMTIALSTAIFAAPEKETKSKKEKPAATAKATEPAFSIVRDGAKVTITWTAPEGEYSVINVERNDSKNAKTRKLVKKVSADTTSYVDTLPDAGGQYWYWLKFAGKGQTKTQVLGPVEVK